MRMEDVFSGMVDPNLISVYIGRVVGIDEDFSNNGKLYVDLTDPNGTDLDTGREKSNLAVASFSLRNLYKCWEAPPEIKSKTQFEGSMSFTSQGDFHLRNYSFDAQTLAWFSTVSLALNAIGVVNTPPVAVSLDLTPIPGTAIAVNVSSAAKEVAQESIDSTLKDLKGEVKGVTTEICPKEVIEDYVKDNDPVYPDPPQPPEPQPIPSGTEVDYTLEIDGKVYPSSTQSSNESKALKKSSRSLRNIPLVKSGGGSHSWDGYENDPVFKIVTAIVQPIKDLVEWALKPITQFIECIDILFEIYDSILDDIQKITIPITQFTEFNSDGTITQPLQTTDMAIKNAIHNKITAFTDKIRNTIDNVINSLLGTIITKIYNPVKSVVETIENKINDIISPIKEKVVELITKYVREPLSKLVSFISMAIQPIVSALPTIAQISTKLGIKKFLDPILGLPIKEILGGVVGKIQSLIDQITQHMTVSGILAELFSTAINKLLSPVIEKLQFNILELLPDFNMECVKDYLNKIKGNLTQFSADEIFPMVYLANDLIKPFHKFSEINWSDSTELKAMVVTVIDSAKHEEGYTPPQETPEAFTVKSLNESIWVNENTIQGSKLTLQSDNPVFIKTGNEETETINKGENLKEGTLMSNDSPKADPLGELSYTKFSSKPEFLPIFEKLHTPSMTQAVVGSQPEMFVDCKPKVWLTNGAGYIEVKENGETKRYIVYYDDNKGTVIGEQSLFYRQGVKITLEKNRVYYSTLVPHIPQSDTDKTVGEDLIPVMENDQPKQLLVQQTVDKDTQNLEQRGISIGDPLYLDPLDQTTYYTFEEICNKYYIPQGKEGEEPYKDSPVYYAWVISKLEDKTVTKEEAQNPNKLLDLLVELLTHAVQALGQDSAFDAEVLIKSLLDKLIPGLSDITDVIEQLKPIISSMLERIDEFKNIEDLLNNADQEIAKIESVINSVIDDAGPAMVGIAKAASALAIQSCSMTQAAQGKDFTFTSGENYDLSTTTDTRSQLPYCKELSRERLIEENCKVLILAVGAGKQNLYAVDILT